MSIKGCVVRFHEAAPAALLLGEVFRAVCRSMSRLGNWVIPKIFPLDAVKQTYYNVLYKHIFPNIPWDCQSGLPINWGDWGSM